MQQEDDLRALAKVMDFMRAISILFVLIHIYWFCYALIQSWGINIGVVDRIFLNFNRTSGLFNSLLYTKIFAVLFLALSCIGTKGIKDSFVTWKKIGILLGCGFILFFLNWWLLNFKSPAAGILYILTLSLGYISLLMSGVWISRLMKNHLMDDVFNNENESFVQETRLLSNDYPVNLIRLFLYFTVKTILK